MGCLLEKYCPPSCTANDSFLSTQVIQSITCGYCDAVQYNLFKTAGYNTLQTDSSLFMHFIKRHYLLLCDQVINANKLNDVFQLSSPANQNEE